MTVEIEFVNPLDGHCDEFVAMSTLLGGNLPDDCLAQQVVPELKFACAVFRFLGATGAIFAIDLNGQREMLIERPGQYDYDSQVDWTAT